MTHQRNQAGSQRPGSTDIEMARRSDEPIPERDSDLRWTPSRDAPEQALGGGGEWSAIHYHLNPEEKKRLKQKKRRGVGFK